MMNPMMAGPHIWWVIPVVMMAGLGGFTAIMLTRVAHRPDLPRISPMRTDPLEIARERYAQGLISQEEFDALVDRLVRTEDKKPLF
ncbi:MAG: SHOCT domain-containing protein [Sulfobacillus sp.]|nr:SHOCT domain-containing protein [Sulfobacillus sp.]